MNFRELRNLELSTLEYLSSEILSNWQNTVTVVKSFNQAVSKWTPKMPIVAVREKDIAPIRKELGSENYRYEVNIFIDIFGTSDGNRLDLAAQITESLKTTWEYKTYSKDSGDDTVNGVDSGKGMRVFNWLQHSKVEFGEDVAPCDKFRHIIAVTVGVR